MSLKHLITKFQEKDERAFQELYTMYSKSMLGVIYNIIKDKDIAQDVLQEVFIKAWQNAHQYVPEKGRFFTWLINIARNAAIDKIRSKSFRNSKRNLNADFFVDILEGNENLNRKNDAIGITKFVAKLAKKCIEIIELLYFKGYTQKEASDTLNMPIGTVKTRNRNCIGELRRMLDD